MILDQIAKLSQFQYQT